MCQILRWLVNWCWCSPISYLHTTVTFIFIHIDTFIFYWFTLIYIFILTILYLQILNIFSNIIQYNCLTTLYNNKNNAMTNHIYFHLKNPSNQPHHHRSCVWEIGHACIQHMNSFFHLSHQGNQPVGYSETLMEHNHHYCTENYCYLNNLKNKWDFNK